MIHRRTNDRDGVALRRGTVVECAVADRGIFEERTIHKEVDVGKAVIDHVTMVVIAITVVVAMTIVLVFFEIAVEAEWADGDGVAVAAEAYRRHIELTDDELDRLEAVMYPRPLDLTCFDLRRVVSNGEQPPGEEWWWALIDPDHIAANAAAARQVFRS